MADLALAANRFAGLESARVPFETAVDASAFGVRISDRGLHRQPMVLERRISTAEEFAEVSVPDPRKDGMVPIVLEAIRDLEKRAPHLPIICGIMAPHMLAFELLGEQEALSMMVNDPSLLKAALRMAQKFGIDYAEAAHDAGADVVAFIDPLARGDFLSYLQYLEFAFPFHRGICDETEKLGIPVILHICGNTTKILPLIAQCGADGVSIDSSVDVLLAKRLLSRKSAVIGNVSTTEILLHGTEEKVRALVMTKRATMMDLRTIFDRVRIKSSSLRPYWRRIDKVLVITYDYYR